MTSVLVTEMAEGVLTMRLNRPEKRNALNTELRNALVQGMEQAGEDSNVRVLILTGTGNTFCAGADLSEYKSTLDNPQPLIDQYRRTNLLADTFHRMQGLGKPVIGQINGYALAGGCGLALACDLLVASDQAQFGFPEVNHGLVAALVMVQLSRMVGRKKALELLLLGNRISAEEALQLGLVNRVVPHERLAEETRALAVELAKKPPMAMQLTKDLFYAVEDAPTAPGLQAARAVNLLARQDRDFYEGATRFLQR